MFSNRLGHRILVPLDSSELATASLPFIRRLSTPETEIELFQVVPDPVPMTELAGTSKFPIARLRAERLQAARAYLEMVKRSLWDVSGYVRTSVTIGVPAAEIIRMAGERECDMVVMASHVRGAIGRMVIGSTTDEVARKATIPVMVIHPHDDSGDGRTADISRIVVPLDGSDLSMRARPVVAEFALRYRLPVILVRAIPLDRERLLVRLEANTSSRQAVAKETFALWLEARSFLHREARKLHARGITVKTRVVAGTPAQKIIGLVNAGDVIIMTSHGEGGARRWMLGSVAQELLQSGVAPVVLVPNREQPEAGTTTTLAEMEVIAPSIGLDADLAIGSGA